jgi:RNA polymerase sigma factor (sigma-70 family)
MLRSPMAFAGWVFVIVRRQCLRLTRILPLGVQSLDSVINSLDLAIRPDAELRFDIASAIQSLPDHYRTILLLRDVEELSIAEIATRLALTREAVKARLHRARLLMREYLAD